MKFEKMTLKNGVRLITVPMQGTETATLVVMVGVGSRYEKGDEAGVSHFIEHMLFKGTKKGRRRFQLRKSWMLLAENTTLLRQKTEPNIM